MAKQATPPSKGPSAPSAPATRNPGRGPAAKPGKTQTGTSAPGTGGPVRDRRRQHRPDPSPDTLPAVAPKRAAPEAGARPRVTAPLPDDTTPRTHAERNS